MKRLISDFKNRPFHLFILTAIVLLIIAVFAGREPFDINFHDTYFVMPLSIAFSVVIILLLLLWGLYKLTEKILWRKWLTWFHVIITIILLTLLLKANLASDDYQTIKLIMDGTVLFALVQILLIVNVVVGMSRSFYKKLRYS